MSKTLELKGVVSDVICIRKNRKNYILYVEDVYGLERRNNKALYIANYATFDEETPQMLKIFANSVDGIIAYADGYLYVAESNIINRLTRYSILQENGGFYLREEEQIRFSSNERMRIQSLTSSKSGKIAVFDMYDGNIYEIRKNGKRSVRHTNDGYGFSHQNLCYVGDTLVSSRDAKICNESKEVLDKYASAIDKASFSETCLHFYDKTSEMVYGRGNVLLFEKGNNFNGLIFFGNKKIESISSNLAGGMIVVSNDYYKGKGYITILNSKDIRRLKESAFEKMNSIKEKIKETMQSIVDCSDGDYEAFVEFSYDFKFRKQNMLEDMKYLIEKGVVGKEALEIYNSVKRH